MDGIKLVRNLLVRDEIGRKFLERRKFRRISMVRNFMQGYEWFLLYITA
jgi:hypothetical protein